MIFRRGIKGGLLCFVLSTLAIQAQESRTRRADNPSSQEPIDVIKVDANLVSVPVIVSDRMGRYVPNLKVESFKLFDSGREQTITYFDAAEEPLNVALLLDTSRSTEGVLDDIKKAAKTFIKTLRPQDNAMIVSFDYGVHYLSRCEVEQTNHVVGQSGRNRSTQTDGGSETAPKIGCINPNIGLTNDRKKLEKAINKAKVGEIVGTSLNDAVMQVANRDLKDIKGRKAIILLSDGQDFGSTISGDELLDAETESETMVYSIYYESDPGGRFLRRLPFPGRRRGVFGRRRPNGQGQGRNQRQRNSNELGAEFLSELSEVTAGRFFKSELTNLKDTFGLIAEELRHQYRLGFYPGEIKKDGSLHPLQVKVDAPDVAVRARKQYRAL
jgi:VWFA-related protein